VIGVDSLAQAIQLALGTEREAAPEPDFFPSDF
jgi:DNA repair protein RadA/Sms